MSYHRGEEIYGPEGPAEHWYRVVCGMAREFALLRDGRRQIVDFLFPGDLFGFVNQYQQVLAVEAVTDGAVVACYPRRRIEMLIDGNPVLGRYIRELAFEAISRAETRMVILGRGSALDKVGCFLLEMAQRSPDGGADELVMRMSRYDVADYLAVAAETVSRALTELQERGAIRLAGKYRVTITGSCALEEAEAC